MNKITSIVLLVGGTVLIVYGISASNSVGSGVSRMINGAPTDKTLWLLIGGGAAALVGLLGVFFGSKST
jgi:VIT1/CCC1 family predicted Fe2+/Mn2+ transporter